MLELPGDNAVILPPRLEPYTLGFNGLPAIGGFMGRVYLRLIVLGVVPAECVITNVKSSSSCSFGFRHEFKRKRLPCSLAPGLESLYVPPIVKLDIVRLRVSPPPYLTFLLMRFSASRFLNVSLWIYCSLSTTLLASSYACFYSSMSLSLSDSTINFSWLNIYSYSASLFFFFSI